MRAVEYRRYAAELILVARDIRNPDDKAALLDMAEKWRQLARKLEAEAKDER
jgi:hypothetical protein